MVFHVATAAEWQLGQADATSSCGRYSPSRLAADGFVHCSPSVEVAREVARAYFAGRGPLVLLTIDEAKLDVPLKWEAPAPLTAEPKTHHQPGRLFPHVYGSLPLSAIVEVAPLEP